MSVPVSVLKQFVESDYKDNVILVTTDNEHRYYYNAHENPSIVWDWDNEVFYALEINEEMADHNKNPMQLTAVSFDEIQFITTFINTTQALDFINKKYDNESDKEVAKLVLQKIKPGQMGPRTIRQFGQNPDGSDKNM